MASILPISRACMSEQARDAIRFLWIAAQPIGQIRSNFGCFDCLSHHVGDSEVRVVCDLLEVFILGPSILFTLCVGFLNLSTLVVNLPLCDQLFSPPGSQCFSIGGNRLELVNWWKVLTQQLRRLPFGQLRLLITFPLALFSPQDACRSLRQARPE